MSPKIDRKFRLARVWSNQELRRFAHLFTGNIINVSGWKDIDKEGDFYRNYFSSATNYTISNFKAEARGFQGMENEIFLDLEGKLPKNLYQQFDVVFNHTVLEHIYQVHQAFENLCAMSKDIVILVVPFLQQMHAHYGDYWRFTPLTIKRMFEENRMEVVYLSFNSHENASIYLFCIASKNKEKWKGKIPYQFNYEDPKPAGDNFENFVGCHAIQNEAYMNRNKTKKSKFSRFLEKIGLK